MERTISQEERMRRAEEIYQRRKMINESGIRVSSDSVNKNKTKASLFKKMGLQLAICSVVYIIFYLIKNTNYIFSEDVINKTKELLSYDINFGNVYQQITSFIEDNKDKLDLFVVNNTIVNEVIKESSNKVENSEAENGGIGGAETDEKEDIATKKSQMEIDAEYIKKNYTFKVPVKGTVTSRYGEREATEIVSANHYGIDIGADTGTTIYAAMEGNVTLVSSEGDYGKHIEISNGEVMTRYAHCSKIVVKKGTKIKKGQKIAEVGETRTCNRTTFTF